MTHLVRFTKPPAAQQFPTRRRIVRKFPRLIAIVSSVVLVAAVTVFAVGSPLKTRAADASQATRSFAWLASTAPPATWARLTLPSLGTLSSPPGFRAVDGDPGTLSLALRNSAGSYLGYLNATPRQGPETLRDWAAFRISHLLGDDAVSVHEDAMVQSVRTETTLRSCIADDYVTTVGHHRFHEVSCYVTSGSVGSVVVAATPSGDPAHLWHQLERSVAAYPFG